MILYVHTHQNSHKHVCDTLASGAQKERHDPNTSNETNDTNHGAMVMRPASPMSMQDHESNQRQLRAKPMIMQVAAVIKRKLPRICLRFLTPHSVG